MRELQDWEKKHPGIAEAEQYLSDTLRSLHPEAWNDGYEEGYQAALAHRRELMACGHPRACLSSRRKEYTGNTPDGNYTGVEEICLACEAVAKARDAALVKAENIASLVSDRVANAIHRLREGVK